MAAYEYFPHDADVGVIGRGARIEDAFAAVAAGMFALMVDPDTVADTDVVHVAFDEADIEIALLRWLNALLGEARVARLALGRFILRRDGDHWSGEGWGEPWRPEHDRGVEVKGATFTMLAVRPVEGGWEARCVVDV